MRLPPLLLALLAAGCVSSQAPQPAAPRAAPEEPPAPAPSPEEENFRARIASLRSPDPAVAFAAALSLPPEHLSLEEIRLQCDLLATRPEVALDPGCEGYRSLGSPDVLRLLRAVVESGEEPGETTLQGLHRMMGAEQIPGLVELLEPAEGSVFRQLLWTLDLLAHNSDRHADDVARGLLFARAAMIAAVAGRDPPRLADFAGARADGATLALLEAAAAPGGPLEGYVFPLPRAWIARLRGEAEAPEGRGPEAFSPSGARAAIAALLAAGPPGEVDDAWAGILRDSPLLEAAAPAEMEGLLEAWRNAPTGFEEGWVALALARLRAPRGWRDREDWPDAGATAEDRLRAALEGEPAGEAVARLGLLGPPALPVLRRLRDERSRGLFWPATAGLATAGDAAARREFLAFLAEDRTYVYDGFFGDPILLSLAGDPEALAHWRSRVGANCCLWNNAHRVLRAWYPTMPCEVRIGDHDGTAARAAAWWARWKDRLRWSRLADGWVPVEEEMAHIGR
jgi:hypothetical protein